MDSTVDESICRLCANRGKNYHAIFTSTSHCIADKINNCLPIIISTDDGLPSDICSGCLESLNISDKLRAQSLVADEILRQQLTVVLIDTIKQEKESGSEDETKEMDISERLFCGICEVKFDDMNSFDTHMEKFHSSVWICNLCNEDFKTSEKLLQHKHTNHYDNTDNPDNSINAGDFEHVDSDVSVDPTDNDESVQIEEEDIPLGCGEVVEEKPIPCNICNVMIETEDLMALHIKFHAPRSMYCSQCFHTYSSPYELFLHKQNIHKSFADQQMKWFCDNCERFSSNRRFLKKHENCGKSRFKCKYCNLEYTKRKELIIHQKKNHFEKTLNDPDIEKFKCPTCEKLFIERTSYNCHVRTHRVRLERKYGCTKCEGNFLNITQLRAHMDDVHVKRRDHECEVCGKAFCSTRSLTAHRKRHITQTCRECGELFENTRILNKHLAAVHNILVPPAGKHSCKECGKKFLKLRLLKDHRNIHSGNRPHVCEICKETFRTYAARWSHVQKHKNGGFYCDYCQRKFSTKGHVRRHLACHLSPDEWTYECEICNEKFQRKSHLNTHVKKHNDTRPFQCDLCDARFLRDKFLLQHKKRRHEGTKPTKIRIKIIPQTV